MTIVFIISGFILGGLLGYTIFYFQYANRHIVNEMRNNLKIIKRENDLLSADAQEHLQQNILLKQKVTELYEKNDDLAKIVSELSRYYYHMKIGSEKMTELSKIMQAPDIDVEEKVSKVLGNSIFQGPQTTEKILSSSSSKKFF